MQQSVNREHDNEGDLVAVAETGGEKPWGIVRGGIYLG